MKNKSTALTKIPSNIQPPPTKAEIIEACAQRLYKQEQQENKERHARAEKLEAENTIELQDLLAATPRPKIESYGRNWQTKKTFTLSIEVTAPASVMHREDEREKLIHAVTSPNLDSIRADLKKRSSMNQSRVSAMLNDPESLKLIDSLIDQIKSVPA